MHSKASKEDILEITSAISQSVEKNQAIVLELVRKQGAELLQMKKDGLSEDLEKDAETEVQELTDRFSEQIDKLIAAKENDIMTI